MQEKEEKRRISRQSTTRCGCGFHAKSVKYGYHHRAQRNPPPLPMIRTDAHILPCAETGMLPVALRAETSVQGRCASVEGFPVLSHWKALLI